MPINAILVAAAKTPNGDVITALTLPHPDGSAGGIPLTLVQRAHLGIAREACLLAYGHKKLAIVEERERARELAEQRAHELEMAQRKGIGKGGAPEYRPRDPKNLLPLARKPRIPARKT